MANLLIIGSKSLHFYLIIDLHNYLSQCVNELLIYLYHLIAYVISFYQLNYFLMSSEFCKEYWEY